MKTLICISCFLMSASLPFHAASAQQVVLAGDPTLSGYQATCGPVQTVMMAMADIAAAQHGRIYLNPALLDRPRAEQMFWYTHECGHFIFGAGEMRADCWAVEQGRIQGWMSPDDFETLSASMRRHPGDRAHPAGPQRVAAMAACYYR